MDYSNKTNKFMDSLIPITHKSYNSKEENIELAFKTLEGSINDMNETSQEIDEIWSKVDTILYNIESGQKRLMKKIDTMKRSIKDLEELL